MLAILALASPITSGSPTANDPAVVAIYRGREPVCTATVISEHAAITAAHCVGDSLVVGDEQLAIETIIRHPAFDRPTLANDLAVVVTSRSIPVAPIERAFDSEMEVGSTVRIVGFGFASVEDQQQLKREGYSTIMKVLPAQLQLAPSPSQPCYGDSGGPVFASTSQGERLVAVVSWGDPGCTKFAIVQRIDLDALFVDDAVAIAETSTDGGGCSSTPTPSAIGLIGLALLTARRGCRSRTAARRSARPAGSSRS